MRIVTPLLFCLLLAVVTTGCASPSGADCVSPFHFEGREYRLAAGPGVKPGDVGEPRAAYTFPGAPAEQAIVLTSADGRRSVRLAHDRPEGGWDPDLNDRTALLGAV